MQYIDSLRTELVMDEFTMQQMRIPDFVIEYEKYWFGPTDAPWMSVSLCKCKKYKNPFGFQINLSEQVVHDKTSES